MMTIRNHKKRGMLLAAIMLACVVMPACSGDRGPKASYGPGQGTGAKPPAPAPTGLPGPHAGRGYHPQQGHPAYGPMAGGGGAGMAGGGGGYPGGMLGPGMPGAQPMSDVPPAMPYDGQPMMGAGPMDPVAEAMMVESLATEEVQLEPNATYSLAVRDAEVKDVFMALGRQSPFNFVVSPDVAGLVTVDMKDVPLERMLDAIAAPLDLTYRIDGDFIWIESIHTTTDLFTLNYIITRRSANRQVTGNSLASAGGETNGGGSGGGSENNTDSVSGNEETQIWESVENGMIMLMSDQGRVDINWESGLITVIDFKDNLVRVEKFLQRVEEALNRQVMIEARLVEITYDKENQFGIDWATVFGDVSTTVGARVTDQVLQSVIDTSHVDATILALKEDMKVSVKNSPNISTLNNQAAIIVLGEQRVFFETNEDIDGQTGQVIRRTSRPRSVTIGVTLHVVPQISADGAIVLNVHQRVTEHIGDAAAPDGTKVPELSVREVDTVARMFNGQTMVIAGLTSERDFKSKSGVPVFSDIPYFGELVTTTRNEKRKTELVLFLTPTLVNP